MPRGLVALLVALIVGVLATPASAHVHGQDHAGTTATATTPALAVPDASALGAAATPKAISTLAVIAAPGANTCDHRCDHLPGAAGCSCMATCVAIALYEPPALARRGAAAGPRPGDAAPWRPTALVPPTPPPRA